MREARRSSYRRFARGERTQIRPPVIILGLFLFAIVVMTLVFLFTGSTPYRAVEDVSPYHHKQFHPKPPHPVKPK